MAGAGELETGVRLGAQTISGRVRLLAPLDLGKSRIVPIIDRFLCDHPAVTVDLQLTDHFVDLVSHSTDFAVRCGALSDSRMKTRLIGSNCSAVCCAPGYLARHGALEHPDDLARHDCIVMRFGSSDRIWSFWVQGEPYAVTRSAGGAS